MGRRAAVVLGAALAAAGAAGNGCSGAPAARATTAQGASVQWVPATPGATASGATTTAQRTTAAQGVPATQGAPSQQGAPPALPAAPTAPPPGAPPTADPTACAALEREWNARAAHAPARCRGDEECGCAHALRSDAQCACSDGPTAEQLRAIAERYHAGSCPWIPTRIGRECQARCVRGQCREQ